MFYCLYKITNWYNGKIYIGVHGTNNLNDSYMGSGILIIKAIKKYGKEYFTKDILEVFDSKVDAYRAENLLITEDFIKREDVYNLNMGGQGSWYSHQQKWKNDEEYRKIDSLRKSEISKQLHKDGKIKGFPNCENFRRQPKSQETKDKISKSLIGNILSKETIEKIQISRSWYTKHSDNTIEKMSQVKLKEGNPLYGLKCMHNPITLERIWSSEEDVYMNLFNGFIFGTGRIGKTANTIWIYNKNTNERKRILSDDAEKYFIFDENWVAGRGKLIIKKK